VNVAQAAAAPSAFFFYLLAAVTVVSAAGVALGRNILYSAFALLGTLAGVAGLYLYLAADFVGVAQLVIYIGGILVLILFAVLLTNRIGDIRISNGSTGLALGIPPVIGLMALLGRVAIQTPWPITEPVAAPTTARLGDAFCASCSCPSKWPPWCC
jgi:NADH-quinone oxidoreductase subunit J